MGNRPTVTLPNAIAATRGHAEDIRERRNNAPEEWRIEGVDIFMLVVCEAAEQFNAQLKAAERRIMLLEEELKQSRYKLEAAGNEQTMLTARNDELKTEVICLHQTNARLSLRLAVVEDYSAAADPATIQEYADYYSEAARLFSVTGEAPMTYAEWLADAQQANGGKS